MNDSADGLLDQWLNRRGTPAADRQAQADDDLVETPAAELEDNDQVEVTVTEVTEIEVTEIDGQVVAIDVVEVDVVEIDGDVVEIDVVEVEVDVVVDQIEPIADVHVDDPEVAVDLEATETTDLSSLADIGDELARLATQQATPRRLPSDDATSAVLAAFAALDSGAMAPLVPSDVLPDTQTETEDPAEEMVEEGSPLGVVDQPDPAVVDLVPDVLSDIHAEPDPAEEMVEEGSPIDPAHPLVSEEPEPQPEPEPDTLPEPEWLDPPDPAIDPTAAASPTVDDLVASLDIPGLAPLSASTSALLASLTAPPVAEAPPAPAPVAPVAEALVTPVAVSADTQPNHRRGRAGFFRRDDEAPAAMEAAPEPASVEAAAVEPAIADEQVDIAIAANGPAHDDHRSPAEIAAALTTAAAPAVSEPSEHVGADAPTAETDEPQPGVPVETTHAIAMPAAGQPYEFTFSTPKVRHGLPTALLFIGVTATIIACWWAFETRSVAAIAIAGVVAVATAIIWAARAGDAAARLYMRGSRLMIERAGSRTQFDLADPHTPLTITGSTETGDWEATFARRGMSAVVLDASVVDPAEFLRVVETYRPASVGEV